MTNVCSDATKLTEKFIVQRAIANDLAAIAGKQATANLAEVSIEERTAWFDEHINSATRPIYVVKIINDKQNDALPSIVAWGSFSDLYARTAYHISSEISIYLHNEYRGQGLGSLLTRWMISQAPTLGIRNIVALIFAHNKPSLNLFSKLGFNQWGYMPQVCDMDGFIADVVMLGLAVKPSDLKKL